jgi:hypothetical protein
MIQGICLVAKHIFVSFQIISKETKSAGHWHAKNGAEVLQTYPRILKPQPAGHIKKHPALFQPKRAHTTYKRAKT